MAMTASKRADRDARRRHDDRDRDRYRVLLLAMLIPFGGHVVKSLLASLMSYMLADPLFHLTHARYGSFQSALSVPNLIVPFLGGMFLDWRGSPRGALLFLALCLVGHVGFTIACAYRHYTLALLARALFGLGQGSTVVVQGRLIATHFRGHEMVFAVAMCESVHNASNWLAKALAVPIADWAHTYLASLWFGVLACAISFVAGLLLCATASDDAPLSTDDIDNHGDDGAVSNRPRSSSLSSTSSSSSLLRSVSGGDDGSGYGALANVEDDPTPSSNVGNPHHHHRTIASLLADPIHFSFALLCVLHLVCSNYAHLFDYIAANMIETRYHVSVEHSAWLSSLAVFLAIFLCPLVALTLDRVGYKMYVVAACAATSCVAYLLFVVSTHHLVPWIAMTLLTLSVVFVPTILRSSVVDLVHRHVYGTAYGLYEVMESLGAVVGHVIVGVLVDATHSYTADLAAFAALAAFACVLALLLSWIDALQHGTLNRKSARIDDAEEAEV